MDARNIPVIVAHRGASRDAPENTLAAFEKAWEQGADAIEGDFRLTADNQVVCIHDANTRRVAGKSRWVSRCSLEELQTLDCGSWKNASFSGQRIPTLAAFLDSVPPGKTALLELKTGPQIVEPLIEALENHLIDSARLTFISFHASSLAALKEHRPELNTRWLHEFPHSPDTLELRKTLATVRACGASSLGLSALPLPTDAFAKALQDAGISLHVWTVDEPDLARQWIRLGAKSLTTNVPARLRQSLSG